MPVLTVTQLDWPVLSSTYTFPALTILSPSAECTVVPLIWSSLIVGHPFAREQGQTSHTASVGS